MIVCACIVHGICSEEIQACLQSSRDQRSNHWVNAMTQDICHESSLHEPWTAAPDTHRSS
jgi:hypothetical protein